MTLTILIALMSAFREAQADESVMISFGPYSPECLEVEFRELRLNGVLRSSYFRPPYVPDITARSALDRVRRSLRSSGSLDEVSISRSSCRPWGRSVPRAPGGPVDLDRHPAGGGPRLDQLERRVRAGVGEQTRALADDHGEDQEVHLVDKVVGEQPPDQVAAAVHLQLPFLLGFQLADGGRDVTGEDGRVLPPRVGECGRGHVLG